MNTIFGGFKFREPVFVACSIIELKLQFQSSTQKTGLYFLLTSKEM